MATSDVSAPGPALRGPAGAVLLTLLLLGAACASSGERPIDPAFDLHDPSGARRAQAVQSVAATGDLAYVPEVIGLLDDPDETVRLQAGAALRDLTGHDTGYLPFESRAERARHIELWRAWWDARADRPERAAESGGEGS